MNTLDFEKTQIWAKNLAENAVPPVPRISAPTTVPSLKKPVLKPLSKEEKVILATGGALAIGLGAIVITSFIDSGEEKPVEKPDLDAPILNLTNTVPEHKEPEPEEKPHHAPPAARPAAQPAVRPASPQREESHRALLEIPDKPEVATRPTDEQTFIEAYNTARAEVGPAGLFVWRDTFYSTFTDKEWASVAPDRQEHWLHGAEPIINPDEQVSAVPEKEHQYVVVAERGDVTWTGIDRNEDGRAEILMGRINGQSPMVLMDTNGDGLLDTRYDYDMTSGKTFATAIDPISMTTSEISQIEEVNVGPDMGFFSEVKGEAGDEDLAVTIVENGSSYMVSLDINKDDTVDAITYFTDERGPVVGIDQDYDGKIESAYVYDQKTEQMQFQEAAPLDEMLVGPPEYSSVSPVMAEEGFDMDTGADEALSFDEQDEDFNEDFDSYFNKGTDHQEEHHS